MWETNKRDSSPDIDQDVKEITSTSVLLQRGTRSLNLGDVEDAINSFVRACELLAKNHGDMAYECGKAYLGYGKALIEHYRQKSNPIEGTAFKDSSLLTKFAKPMFVDEQYDDEVEEATSNEGPVEGSSKSADRRKKASDAARQIADQKATEAVADVKDSEKSSESRSDKNNEDSKEEKEQEGEQEPDQEDDNEENVNDSEAVAVENEETEDETAEKEVTDLEVAWEMLELAKIIFNKSDKSDKNKNFLAETLISLGEISLENEQFSTAIEDIKKGLDLMIELHSTDYVVHRDLAESVFRLGMAYQLNYETDNAISCFNKSKSYLNDRLQEIKNDSSEHAEIVKLIEEIDEKISDAVEMKNNCFSVLSAAKNEPGCSSAAGSSSSTSSSMAAGTSAAAAAAAATSSSASSSSRTVQANDISHLVKRKRPDAKNDSKFETQPSKQFKSG